MGLPIYPLVSMSALVQGDALPLMQKVIFPVEHQASETLQATPDQEASRLRAFREMVSAFNKVGKL